jgi:outer membrane protein OmpA-like peptidoglycan-associated protein
MGQISSPDAMKGDTLLGTISQTSSSRGQSSVTFTFNTLRHGNENISVSASLQGVSNSKGQPAVDENGHALRATNTAGAKPASASKFGSQLGGLIGGRTGQAVSDAGDDVNTSGSAGVMQISSNGNFNLGAGASLTISAKTSGNGPSLSGLTPNTPGPSRPPVMQVAVASASAATPSAAQPGATGNAGGQPELKATKIEFVPGERVVFFDDFSDMVEDEPPPHWKVRDGKVELRTGGGIRELHAEDTVDLTSPSFAIPPNFTFEIDWTGGGEMAWHFANKSGEDILTINVRGEESGDTATASAIGPDGSLGSGSITVDTSKPVHFAFWAQQGRVRAYLNGERLVDANQVQFGEMDHLLVNFARYRANGLRQVRLAESAPDFSTVINASGKYVTHGIRFATDSDRLEPESAAVIKQIATAFAKNPNLKLEIDGYTDSVGNAAHNLDLSKRRAQAVQAVLMSQFGVSADQLSSNGLGAGNPIGSNDTPDGRANNRRVEFIKK